MKNEISNKCLSLLSEPFVERVSVFIFFCFFVIVFSVLFFFLFALLKNRFLRPSDERGPVCANPLVAIVWRTWFVASARVKTGLRGKVYFFFSVELNF